MRRTALLGGKEHTAAVLELQLWLVRPNQIPNFRFRELCCFFSHIEGIQYAGNLILSTK